MPRRRASVALAVCVPLVLLGTACSGGDGGSSTPTAGSPSGSTSAGTVVSGERVYTGLTRNHVDGEVAYPQSPPVGGDHSPVWVPCDGRVYSEPVPNVNAVHSMEHGAVWVTWQPSLATAEIETLHAEIEGIDYRFGSPYPGLTAPITLTAWGHQMDATSATDPRIATFLAAYTDGPQTPEPGATCAGPADGTSMTPDVHTS